MSRQSPPRPDSSLTNPHGPKPQLGVPLVQTTSERPQGTSDENTGDYIRLANTILQYKKGQTAGLLSGSLADRATGLTRMFTGRGPAESAAKHFLKTIHAIPPDDPEGSSKKSQAVKAFRAVLTGTPSIDRGGKGPTLWAKYTGMLRGGSDTPADAVLRKPEKR